jgi:hypothetical protein
MKPAQPERPAVSGAVTGSAITDSQRLDWLEET